MSPYPRLIAGCAVLIVAAGPGHAAHLLGDTVHLTANGPTAGQVESDLGGATVDGTFEFPNLDAGSLAVSVTDTTIIFQNRLFSDSLDFFYDPGVFNGFEFQFAGGKPIVGAGPDFGGAPFGVATPVTTVGNDVFVDLSGVFLQPGGEAIVDVTTLPPTAAVPEPTAWTLMLAGLFTIGATLRTAGARRRQAARAILT